MSHLEYTYKIKDGVSPQPFECSAQAYGSLAFFVSSDV